MFLRQSTASQEILLGPFVDSTDGNTAETALTIANTDILLFKAGATTLAGKNSGGATHISGGYYGATLDATDTDTLGNLEIDVHVAGALAVKREYVVLPAKVYDSLVLGTDNLEVDLVLVGGSAATVNTTDLPAIKAKTDNLPANPAAVGSAMTLVFTQAVPSSNTAGTVGDSLNAARAQGFGKWAKSGTTLTLYGADGTTVVRTFTLDDATTPTSRT